VSFVATAKAGLMVQALAPAAIVHVDPDEAPFWNSVTVNVSPAGTLVPNVKPADVTVPPAATVATLHVAADALAHAVDNDTYSGAAVTLTVTAVVAVDVVLVPGPEVRLTCSSTLSFATTERLAVIVHVVVAPFPVIVQLSPVVAPFRNNTIE
jgi:hypothetical protein